MKKKKKKKQQIQFKSQPPKRQFNCIRCGYCCIFSTPSFTKEEYKKVRDLKITKDRKVTFQKINFGVTNLNGRDVQEYAYFTANGYTTFKMGAKSAKIQDPPPCEYLDQDEEGFYSCAIYPFRPSVCRDFGVKEWDCPNNPDYLKKGNGYDELPFINIGFFQKLIQQQLLLYSLLQLLQQALLLLLLLHLLLNFLQLLPLQLLLLR